MELNIVNEVAALQRLTIAQLQQRFARRPTGTTRGPTVRRTRPGRGGRECLYSFQPFQRPTLPQGGQSPVAGSRTTPSLRVGYELVHRRTGGSPLGPIRFRLPGLLHAHFR